MSHVLKELSVTSLHEQQAILFAHLDKALELKIELEEKQKFYDAHMQKVEFLKSQMYRILRTGRTLYNEYAKDT